MSSLQANLPQMIKRLDQAVALSEPLNALNQLPFIGGNRNNGLSERATEKLLLLLDEGLRQGGLGIGMAHQYYPGASPPVKLLLE